MGRVEEGSVQRKKMKFRKKPVEVEAVRFYPSPEGLENLKVFCGVSLGRVLRGQGQPAEAEICTLEDGNRLVVRHIATEGDWVIKGIKGEYYPCKPDIFEATYEPVS